VEFLRVCLSLLTKGEAHVVVTALDSEKNVSVAVAGEREALAAVTEEDDIDIDIEEVVERGVDVL
jgi:hypothetical protein